MKFSRAAVINTVLIAVIVIAAASVLIIFNPFGGKTASATTQLTGTVEQGVVSTTITADGNIAPVQEVDASFGASGTVATVNVALGATVTKGQLLGTLQTSDLQTAVTNDETDLYHDQIILDDDYTSLASAKTSPNGNVEQSQQQVYSQESTVADAQTTVTSAKEALADATLKSPIAGLVIAVNDAAGDSVSGTSSSSSSSSGSGTGGTGSSTGSTSSTSTTSSSSSSAFVEIADTSKYTVTADIAEADIADVAVGQAATVTFPAISASASSPATVTAIAPTGTTSNSIVTYATTITLTTPPTNLRIGQTADVTITTKASKATALYVPAAAITTADGTSTVKVVKNGKTSAVTVTLGIVGDDGTQIDSGLTAGETIVIGNVSTATTTTGTTGTGTTGTGTGTGGFGGGGFGGGTGGGGRNFGGGGNG